MDTRAESRLDALAVKKLANLIPPDLEWQRYEEEPEEHRLKSAADYEQEVIDAACNPTQASGLPFPFLTAWGSFRFRPGEVTLWSGANGNRKSMVLAQVMGYAARHDEGSVTASFEMAPARTLERMLAQAAGTQQWTPSYARKWFAWARARIWLYDHLGSVTPQRVVALIRYVKEKTAAKHVVVDSLMKCGIDPDDYSKQKRFVDALSKVAKETDLHVHLVAHNRKSSNIHDEADKYSVKGGSELTDMPDNVILVVKNRKKEEAMQSGDPAQIEAYRDKADQVLKIDKQRNGDFEGSIRLWFHRNGLSFSEQSGRAHAPLELGGREPGEEG